MHRVCGIFIGLAFAYCRGIFAQELVVIPEGTYEVTDQVTSLKVTISVSGFLIAATEVTQKQYEEITSMNPSVYKGADRPVENVSWWNAIRYCNLRSQREGLSPCYDLTSGRRNLQCTGYRLPTETEWIRAAGKLPPTAKLHESANLGVVHTKSVHELESAMKMGTAPVRSRKPNEFGLYDMRGNVWEWCEDFFDVIISPDAVRDPTGPASGLARVIRGGSFVSTTSRWSRDYRSSIDPASRSGFTGFRVVRSAKIDSHETITSEEFFRRYNSPPPGFETSIGLLTPLVQSGMSLDHWKQTAASLRAKWEGLLQPPRHLSGPVTVKLIREVQQRNFSGRLLELEMEPGVWEKIYVLEPRRTSDPRPVIIVPYYDVDTPAATDLGGRNFAPAREVSAFAYIAAQHGYLAVAVRWFGESYGESYSEAVANLAQRHPGSTGLGKWVADARRVCDFIETLPSADSKRIGVIGHSLGGKMALYAAALEPRIRAVVSSELGIGFKFSNYDDYWYLGEKLDQAPPGTDQHELIALIAPRPFLLIGGDEYDKNESWHYINAARPVYRLFGEPQNVGYLNHHTGHTPSPSSVASAFDWLDYLLKPRIP